MTDIVIPIGHFSKWSDNEIRYCLRSIEKYLTGYGNIWLIGYCPKFLRQITIVKEFKEDRKVSASSDSICGVGTDVVITKSSSLNVIKADDSDRKQKSIFDKLILACKDERISDPFLLMNDDHYWLKQIYVSEIDYWYSYDLRWLHTHAEGLYKHAVKHTLTYLEKNNLPIKNFDIHCPIIYEKEKLLKLSEINWEKDYAIKSLYCNTYGIEGTSALDLKIGKGMRKEEIYQVIDGRAWFSVGENGVKESMKKIFEELYPEKSIYEL